MNPRLPSSVTGRLIHQLRMGPFATPALAESPAEWWYAELLLFLDGGITLALVPHSCQVAAEPVMADPALEVPADILSLCTGALVTDVVESLASGEVLVLLGGARLLENASLLEGTRPYTALTSELQPEELEEAYVSRISGRSGPLPSFLDGWLSPG